MKELFSSLEGMKNRDENLANRERYEQAQWLITRAFLFDVKKGEKPGDFLKRYMPERCREFTSAHFYPPQHK